MIIDSISERITKRVSENLQNEIVELLKPMCERITLGSKRQYYLDVKGQRIHYLDLVKLLEIMIYDQEIEEKTETEMAVFMAKIDNS